MKEEVVETQTLRGHLYKTNFLSTSRVNSSTMKFQSEFYDLYAHAQSISLLWSKFQTITLNTVGVAETQTIL